MVGYEPDYFLAGCSDFLNHKVTPGWVHNELNNESRHSSKTINNINQCDFQIWRTRTSVLDSLLKIKRGSFY